MAKSEAQKRAHKKWAAANPDKVRAAAARWREDNRQHIGAYLLAWKDANPGRVASYNAAYQSATTGQTPRWADMNAINAIYVEARKLGLTVDHIIPLRGKTVCGLHIETNLRMITHSENASKGNKLLESV